MLIVFSFNLRKNKSVPLYVKYSFIKFVKAILYKWINKERNLKTKRFIDKVGLKVSHLKTAMVIE